MFLLATLKLFTGGGACASSLSQVTELRLKPIKYFDQLCALRLADWNEYRNINLNPRPAGYNRQVSTNSSTTPLFRCALSCLYYSNMADCMRLQRFSAFGASPRHSSTVLVR